jgi:hypothetical protein
MTTKSMMQVAFATLVAVVALSISGEKEPANGQSNPTSANTAPLKRDLYGFSLGMTDVEAEKLARKQCFYLQCYPTNTSFCRGINVLRDIHWVGGDFFASANKNADVYQCSNHKDVAVDFSITPQTKKIYKLVASVASRMNCDEILAFVKEQFGVTGDYTVFFPKSKSGYMCDGWLWKVNPGYTLRIVPNFGGQSFEVQMIDAEVVKENEAAAEELRQRSVTTKPRL